MDYENMFDMAMSLLDIALSEYEYMIGCDTIDCNSVGLWKYILSMVILDHEYIYLIWPLCLSDASLTDYKYIY